MMDILEAVSGGSKKTHIGQRANLNHLRLNRYLADLSSRRLIIMVKNLDGEDLYEITDEGKAILMMFRALHEGLSQKK